MGSKFHNVRRGDYGYNNEQCIKYISNDCESTGKKYHKALNIFTLWLNWPYQKSLNT